MEYNPPWKYWLTGALFGLFIGLVIARPLAEKTLVLPVLQDAVKHGAAYWKVDDAGETTFTWKQGN